MAHIDFTVETMKPLILDTITNSEKPITEIELMKTLECTYTKRAYALGRATQQLIHEGVIYIDPKEHQLHLIDTHTPQGAGPLRGSDLEKMEKKFKEMYK